MHMPDWPNRPPLLRKAFAMTCNAEEIQWLMEWAVLLLIVLAFGIAGAIRWAAAKGKSHE